MKRWTNWMIASVASAYAIVGGVGVHAQQGATPTATPKTFTSEEIRLADIGQGDAVVTVGKRYRVVGRIRSIEADDAGSPRIVFTGLRASLGQDVDRNVIERLSPGMYVSVSCTFTKPDDNIFPLLTRCTDIAQIAKVSAAEYEVAYDQNLFRADSMFRDKEVIISGEVRLISKLIDGQTYVSLHARRDFSDVTAVVSSDAKGMISEYALAGKLAMMLCRGGYRYNQIGSVGLKECRFLQNY